MTRKIKIHDGIVGTIVLASAALGMAVDPRWMALAGITGLIMISSAFTGFCPVHYSVGKFIKE